MKEFFVNLIKEPTDGSPSKKGLIIVVNYCLIALMAIFMTVMDRILNRSVNPSTSDVFHSLLVFQVLLMGLNEATKKITDKVTKTDTDEPS